MQRIPGSLPLVVLALTATVGAAACSAAKQTPPETDQGHRTIAEGYSLLYGIASQQKSVDKLLLVKLESKPVDLFINELSHVMTDLCSELEDLSKRYPALDVRTQFLPSVEVKARESMAAETRDRLLAKKGKEFERFLLLTQLNALDSEYHIAKVMLDLETADERRVFWRRTEKRLGDLRAKANRLLERDYFR